MTNRQKQASMKEASFTILEQFLKGKAREQNLCEDGIAVTPDFAAVIDGSTSKGSLRLEGKTTGRVAMELLTDAIKHVLSPDDDMPRAVQKLTACLNSVYERYGILEEVTLHPENRLTASMVIYSVHRHEVWMLGDCLCRFNGMTYTHPKPADSILGEIRADILSYLLQKGHSIADLRKHDMGREWIWPYLKDQCAFQNAGDCGPFGYAVLDGFPVDIRQMHLLPLPEETQELVLASDGYPVLCDTLEASEHELEQRLTVDPLCITSPPATKGKMEEYESFDDRAYLRIALKRQ